MYQKYFIGNLIKRLLTKPVAVLGIWFFIGILFGFIFWVFDKLSTAKYFNSEFYTNETNNLLESVYFSFITLATIGYGDIHPEFWIIRVFVVLESTIGMFLFTMLALSVAYAGSKNIGSITIKELFFEHFAIHESGLDGKHIAVKYHGAGHEMQSISAKIIIYIASDRQGIDDKCRAFSLIFNQILEYSDGLIRFDLEDIFEVIGKSSTICTLPPDHAKLTTENPLLGGQQSAKNRCIYLSYSKRFGSQPQVIAFGENMQIYFQLKYSILNILHTKIVLIDRNDLCEVLLCESSAAGFRSQKLYTEDENLTHVPCFHKVCI